PPGAEGGRREPPELGAPLPRLFLDHGQLDAELAEDEPDKTGVRAEGIVMKRRHDTRGLCCQAGGNKAGAVTCRHIRAPQTGWHDGLSPYRTAAGPTQLDSLREDSRPRAFPELFTARTQAARSEERRVGKECRSRWSPYRKNNR